MIDAMVHRGPDDEGLYSDPGSGIALGARRLSIIDVADGHQPVHSEDRRIWAVLNGEIYNHPQLRDVLRERGHEFASATDTEVLVHLYEDYGDELVHALDGMYAFAIWDQAERRLLLGRDRFGEKPLFYAENDGGLVFASELTALRRGLASAPAPDAAVMDMYFVLGYVPGENSLLSGVRQLPPATLLRWAEGSSDVELREYWSMPASPKVRKDSIGHLAEEGLELLRDSVRSRLISDVPLGLFLSGGLDSTLLGAIAADQISGALKTFTVGYGVHGIDETEQARRVAAWLGSDHLEVRLSTDELAREAVGVISALDEPNADPALLALNAVAKVARPSITVAIGGEGADELFGGYPRYRWVARGAAAQRYLPRGIAANMEQGLRRLTTGRVARLADVVGPEDTISRNLDWMTAGRRHARPVLYGERLRERVCHDAAIDDAAAIADGSGAGGIVARLMSLDQQRYLPDDVLAKADRATMLTSLEMRSPYLSRRLAEFAASIPATVHTSHGGKAVLRAMAKQLSAGLVTRRAKRAFSVPVAAWLQGPLRQTLQEQAEAGPMVRDGWIDRAGLQKAVSEHLGGVADRSGVLWPILVAGLWMDVEPGR
jgi:asparagine synthase (glutamine-hydrolysing)